MKLQPGDKVTLGEGGPAMVVWKIIEGEALCRWYDAFGDMHQRPFHLQQLKKAEGDDE